VREFYQVLGVRSDVADEEIKATFRRLAKQLHPDLHPGMRTRKGGCSKSYAPTRH
jgi:curved DNA-binding protein CbpA